jgi:molecular chaperone GrpE
MKRLYVVNGKPQVFKPGQLNVDYLMKHTASENEQVNEEHFISAYCVHINITKVNIPRHFPLIVKKDTITKTNRNVNECCEMYVDNIMLEDLIKFQGIECQVLDGMYWTGTKDFTMRDVIQTLHELRCEYKVTKNPMQEIIKLIMNSAYGKTIQKPIKNNTVYKKVQTLQRTYRKFGKDKKETPKDDFEAKYEDLNNKYLRLAADFDNFRKRTLQEKEDLSKYAAAEVLKKLTTVLDTFDRASEHLKDIEDCKTVKDSYEVAIKQFIETLKKCGMEEIEAVGKEFNPNEHEAITQVPTNDFEPDTVTFVAQKGYKMGDRIIRPALVGVAKKEDE